MLIRNVLCFCGELSVMNFIVVLVLCRLLVICFCCFSGNRMLVFMLIIIVCLMWMCLSFLCMLLLLYLVMLN